MRIGFSAFHQSFFRHDHLCRAVAVLDEIGFTNERIELIELADLNKLHQIGICDFAVSFGEEVAHNGIRQLDDLSGYLIADCTLVALKEHES